MSETAIRKKLAHAYNKVGKILGREFDVYRPVTLNDSLSTQNFVAKMYAAPTLSEKFTSPQTEGYKAYIVYANMNSLFPGDILNDVDETFVIIWNRGIEDPIAIRATDLVEIHSVGWETTNGLVQTRTLTAKNVPVSVTKASSTTDSRLTNVQNTAQANRWEVRIWSPTNPILQTDNIIFQDGTVLHIDSMQTSDLTQILTCSEVKI